MRKYKFEDDRTPLEVKQTLGFVVATDKFMSGWGAAPVSSVIAVPFVSEEDKENVLRRVNRRGEMKRVRVVYGEQYKSNLSKGCHLHIYDTTKSFRYSL